ncbi:MAG: DUF1611 domain-containing protein [Rhodospirillales bacterium]|nr:DUF1611 domain-containing protein [Alphaproteobacteria bacterium]MCB1839745.1 DUF1611 domain-containing protein [Alphaproteobacteria bacterium]MCB9977191.1 DUF1611 domain-containing protein [Rhodospirillales bacterium]
MRSATVKLSSLGDSFEGVTAKAGTVLRHVKFEDMAGLTLSEQPMIGDVLLAKVVRVGDKDTLQTKNGRNLQLHPGDKVLVAYGNRYAVSEYHAHVPPDMRVCHLVSSGGVASYIESSNSFMGRPTLIKPLGLAVNADGQVMNMKDYSLRPPGFVLRNRPTAIVVLGTGMDSGKTTTAAALVKGLERAGFAPGFGKMTGTGLSSDIHKPQDAGAVAICDFVDMGYPSTYEVSTKELVEIFDALTANLTLRSSKVNIIEIADGVLQSDNQQLLRSEAFTSKIDGVILAASGGLSALYAAEELKRLNIPVLTVSGLFTTAPLAVQEFTDHIPPASRPLLGVLTPKQLMMKKNALLLMDTVQGRVQPANDSRRDGEPEAVELSA